MNTLKINVVDFESTGHRNYFRGRDVAPELSGDTLTIIDGYGMRRSWGTPSVRSIVRQLTETVVSVEVIGWHKHTVSPVGGMFYFVNEGDGWVRRTANAKVVKAALAK